MNKDYKTLFKTAQNKFNASIELVEASLDDIIKYKNIV